MKKRLENMAFWILVCVVLAAVHVGMFYLVGWLFKHGSSSAFDFGIFVCVLDVIFWCFIYVMFSDLYRRHKRFVRHGKV